MMRLLWISVNKINFGDKVAQSGRSVFCGWIEGAISEILINKEIELAVAFPDRHIFSKKAEGVSFYSFPPVPPVRNRNFTHYSTKNFKRLNDIIQEFKPDVIQIFGTESWFQRQFVYMLNDLGLIDKTIVWIQGLMGCYADCYTDGLTLSQIRTRTFWETLRGTNVQGMQRRFVLNGEGEKDVLRTLRHVFVRTDWDASCCRAVNPDIQLHFCNETLRPSFYQGDCWELKKIRRHSIFVSQYSYPIKGFHQLLKAFPLIKRYYPDATIYVAGGDLFLKDKSMLDKIRENGYRRMLRQMILESGIRDSIVFLGMLDAEKMKQQYLSAHVFVTASSIENSCNSIGEAMITGTPIVASYVGGTPFILEDKTEGLLYPYHEYALLADKVCEIFGNDDLACSLSEAAHRHAMKTHDVRNNYECLIREYRLMTAETP